MKKMEVFDPPMCCSTGVCGPKVDPALVQFAADLNWLSTKEVVVERYNLAQQPHAFAANETVKETLRQRGHKCLPLILLDGAAVSQGRYPSRVELAGFAGVEPEQQAQSPSGAQLPVINSRCC
ncbi:MAG: arsenite efflux transporter metallochaperone ArsD [Acidobacteria bacterium]|nr:arsenite efflux transporter metallochaperone ArsD [Acidobacteriota bacterium]